MLIYWRVNRGKSSKQRPFLQAFCDAFVLNDAIKVIKSSMPCANVTWMKFLPLPVYLKTDHGIIWHRHLLDVFLGNINFRIKT